MRYRELHSWEVSYREAVQQQERLEKRLIIKGPVKSPRIIAGADVAYSKVSDRLYAGVVLMDFDGMRKVEEATVVGRSSFPYIPGLLSFREGPVLLKAFSILEKEPEVVLFDGQGIAHPRGLGLASHIGLILGKSSIGCAKKLLIGEHKPAGSKAGSFSYILYKGRRVGVVLRTRKGVKPIFVSPGHKIDIPSSVRIVLDSCRGYRLPEPIRQAHNLVSLLRRKWEGSDSTKISQPPCYSPD
jgi:deoxyribonuclease V